MAQTVAAGAAVIIGVVVRQGAGDSLGYSVVSVPATGREQFTNDRGLFSLRELPTGSLRLRIKHIGFTPLDTVIPLRENDTVRVRIALARLVVELPAVHVAGACGTGKPNAKESEALAALFDQVQQNAERYRLLAQSHPFQLKVEHTRGPKRPNGDFVPPLQVDTVMEEGLPPYPYQVGHLTHLVLNYTGPGRIPRILTVPTITDFADTAFSNNHCFTYAGRAKVDGVPVLRVDYQPTPSLKKVVDIKGTIYVREDGYQLVRADMELTGVPPELGTTNMKGMRVQATFTEVVPGVPITATVESMETLRGTPDGIGERVAVMNVHWVKDPP